MTGLPFIAMNDLSRRVWASARLLFSRLATVTLLGVGAVSCGGAGPSASACDATGWCWETEPQPLRGATSVWVASARESWTLVSGGVVRMRDGVATRFSFSAPVGIHGVWGSREGEPWVSTVEGIQRFDGTTFRTQITDSPRLLRGPNGQFLVGDSTGMRRWNGASFDAPIPVGDAICVTANGDIVERVEGNLVRRSGAMTAMIGPVPIEPGARLYCAGRSVVAVHEGRAAMVSMDTGAAVAFTAPANVARWVVSTHGELFAADMDRHVFRVEESGRSTAVFDLPPEVGSPLSESLTGLDVEPSSGVAYVVSGAYAYRYERGAWTPRLENNNADLHWFWGASGQAPAVAFATNAFATRAASGAWTFQPYPMGIDTVSSMVGSDANNAYLSTSAGALLRWNLASGVTVADASAMVTTVLLARSERDLWGVGAAGLRHWDGSAWSTVALPANMQGASSMIVDNDGTMFVILFQVEPPGVMVPHLYRFDGATLTPEPSPNPEVVFTTLGAGKLLIDDAGALWMRSIRRLYVRPRGASEFVRIEANGAPLEISNITAAPGGVIASREVSLNPPEFTVVDSATRTARTHVVRPYVRRNVDTSEAIWPAGATQLWIGNENGGVQRWSAR